MKNKSIMFMTAVVAGIIISGLWLPAGAEDTAETDAFITLATTTSTENSGLLGYLHPEFTKDTGIRVKVIPRGTGASLKLGEKGDCDVVMVHAREQENAFVDAGFGTKRYDLMHNDFVLLGPKSDPAGAAGKAIIDAMKAIDSTKSVFISRGDNSGTHTKENVLWDAAGITPGDYRLGVGQGMGKTLIIADEKQAYTLSDRGTWLAMKDTLDLTIHSEGAPELANPYSIIPVNPEKHPHVKYDMAMTYVNWLQSPKGQNLINAYRKNGDQLFHADVLGGKLAETSAETSTEAPAEASTETQAAVSDCN
ncbi:MAG TPA: substrate-binding domain-containing protein [bacterium]|nr:substrate-binding domain-containing protein [bacterium]